MERASNIYAFFALLVIFLAACQANNPSRTEEAGNASKVGVTGWVGCPSACIPRVELLDAVALDSLTVDENGRYTAPFRETGLRYLAVSAPGHQPQLLRLDAGMYPPAITLVMAQDPRQAYLFGVTVDAVIGGTQRSRSTLRPVPDKEILLTRGRAQIRLRSNVQGEFLKALPAGHYDILIDGRRHSIDLPQQGSLFLPLVLSRTLVE